MSRIFRILLLVGLISSEVSPLSAQQHRSVQNLLQADEKRIHFGFTLGVDFLSLGVRQSNRVAPDGNVYAMSVTKYHPGFAVGVISDLRLCNHLNLRFVPLFHFADRECTFVDQDRNVAKSYMLKSTVMDFPFYVKFSSKRINNYRPYLLLGAGVSYEIGRQRGETLLLKPVDVNIEFGVGCDFYLPYFKFAPELKFSLGMLNVLEKDRSDLRVIDERKYTEALLKLTDRLLVLTFNFE